MKNATETMAPSVDSLVAEAADRFTDDVKEGRAPSIEDYAERYPEIASIIRQVFPALAVLDNSGAVAGISDPGRIEDPASSIAHPVAGILGDFRILHEIGRGGMGVVYEAEQLSIGRRVALKVLPFAAMLDKQQLARFKNEARAAGTLDHPNIVPIYAVGVERGVHYYAMQLVEGRSLAEIIGKLREKSVVRGPWSVAKATDPPAMDNGQRTTDTAPVVALSTLPDFSSREYYQAVARLGIQAAEALDHAHECGILHRDIKPANLLLDDDGKLWMTDFGLARIEQDAGMTMTGDLLGTLRYMSPEQALAKRVVVDHRSDIYSLGVTLYELLTLRPAFTGEDRQELLRQITFDEPRPLRQINHDIPIELETIILESIGKSPEQRYATANELAEDLRSFLEHKPIKAKPPTLREKVVKWTRRHPAAVRAIVIVATATAIASAVSTLLINRAYHQEFVQRQAAEKSKREAEASARRAEQIATFLTDAFRRPTPDRGGFTVTIAEVLAEAVKKLHNSFNDDPTTKARLMMDIGNTYLSLGLDKEAASLFEQSYRITIANDPLDTNKLRATYHLIAGSIRTGDQENLAKAISLGEEMLHSAAAKKLGPDHPETINLMEALAAACFNSGRREKGLRLAVQAYQLTKNGRGFAANRINHVTNLANIYYATDRHADGNALLEEVADVVLNANNPHLCIKFLAGLDFIYYRYDKCRDVSNSINERIVQRLESSLGRNHIDTLRSIRSLAFKYYSQDPKKALPLLEEVLEQFRSQRGPKDRDIAETMRYLASSLNSVGRQEEALKLIDKAVALHREIFGSESLDTASALRVQMRLQYASGLYEEAVSGGQQIIEVGQKCRSNGDYEEEFPTIASSLCALGRTGEAIRWWIEAAEPYKRFRKELPKEASNWHKQAACLLGAKQVDEFLNVRREMMGYFFDVEGDGDVESAWTGVPLPFADDDLELLFRLTDRLQAKHVQPNLVAALLFRCGRFQEAAEIWHELAKHGAGFSAWDHAFMAMTLHQIGQTDEAAAQLEQAKAYLLTSRTKDGWWTQIETDLLVKEAETLLAGNDKLPNAEANEAEILKRNPNSATAYNVLASRSLAAGKLTAAATAYEQALKLEPKNWEFARRLAIVKCRQASQTADSSDWDAAEAATTIAIDLMPKWAAHFDEPRNRSSREFMQWDEVFERKMKKYPKSRSMWTGRAHFHLLNRQWSEAAGDYAKLSTTEPLSDFTWEYAFLLVLVGDLPAYERLCDEIADRNVVHPYELFVVSSVLNASPTSADNKERVLHKAKDAAEGRPDRWTHANLGLAYFRAGQYEAAIEPLEKALAEVTLRGFDKAGNDYLLAAVYHELGQADEAQAHFMKAELEMADVASPADPAGIPPFLWIWTHVIQREVKTLLGTTPHLITPATDTAQPVKKAG